MGHRGALERSACMMAPLTLVALWHTNQQSHTLLLCPNFGPSSSLVVAWRKWIPAKRYRTPHGPAKSSEKMQSQRKHCLESRGVQDALRSSHGVLCLGDDAGQELEVEDRGADRAQQLPLQ